MKIAVFSDTHGKIDGVLSVIDGYTPDLIVHLGDCPMDAENIRARYPHIPMEAVTGNWHEDKRYDVVKNIAPMGVRLLLTHGHLHVSKNDPDDLDALEREARRAKAALVLFGHTHMPMNKVIDGIRYLNPGTAGMSRYPTWARIELEDGEITHVSVESV